MSTMLAAFNVCETLARCFMAVLFAVALASPLLFRPTFGLMLSRLADHYAEAAMYLRLNGVLPPTAKK